MAQTGPTSAPYTSTFLQKFKNFSTSSYLRLSMTTFPLQPVGSKLCGHCCLAVILGCTLPEAISKVGHSRGTKTRELTVHFSHEKTRVGQPTEFSLCIARPVGVRKGNWHWILYWGGGIYDPTIGDFITLEDYLQIYGYRIMSYIRIL